MLLHLTVGPSKVRHTCLIALTTNKTFPTNMAVMIDLNETTMFHQGLPEQVKDWLTTNVGLIYYKDEIWRHNQQVFSQQLQSAHLLGTVLNSIQSEAEYPHECSIMTVIHACGWNFTRKRKLATSAASLSIKQFTSAFLRIEDDALALRFSLAWLS